MSGQLRLSGRQRVLDHSGEAQAARQELLVSRLGVVVHVRVVEIGAVGHHDICAILCDCSVQSSVVPPVSVAGSRPFRDAALLVEVVEARPPRLDAVPAIHEIEERCDTITELKKKLRVGF